MGGTPCVNSESFLLFSHKSKNPDLGSFFHFLKGFEKLHAHPLNLKA